MPPKAKKSLVVLDQPNSTRGTEAVQQFQTVANRMGYSWTAIMRSIDEPAINELESATRIVCVCAPEFRPAVESRFPSVSQRIEYWPATGSLDETINTFVATLLGGGFREIPPPAPPPPVAKKLGTAKVGRETAGRKGKGVTVIWELGLNESQLQELATSLKQKCGTGGTVKDGRIEIQGDHRDRIVVELEKIGYKVKRAGG